MTGGSPDEGSRSTARIATRRSPKWILREPRIGPVVTFSSVRAGASAILLTPLPSAGANRIRFDGSGGAPPISAARQQLPREESSLKAAGPARQPRRADPEETWLRRLLLARRHGRLALGRADGAVVIGVEPVEHREARRAIF